MLLLGHQLCWEVAVGDIVLEAIRDIVLGSCYWGLYFGKLLLGILCGEVSIGDIVLGSCYSGY